jgi:hypothetical protein
MTTVNEIFRDLGLGLITRVDIAACGCPACREVLDELDDCTMASVDDTGRGQ